MEIYRCENRRCRLVGDDRRLRENERFCVSCRMLMKRIVATDMPEEVKLISIPEISAENVQLGIGVKSLEKANESFLNDRDFSVEDDDRSVSIAQTICDAGVLLDSVDVPTEDRIIFGQADDVVEWIEKRDSINESFINLRNHASSVGAFYVESRLLELNRELLNCIDLKEDE